MLEDKYEAFRNELLADQSMTVTTADNLMRTAQIGGIDTARAIAQDRSDYLEKRGTDLPRPQAHHEAERLACAYRRSANEATGEGRSSRSSRIPSLREAQNTLKGPDQSLKFLAVTNVVDQGEGTFRTRLKRDLRTSRFLCACGLIFAVATFLTWLFTRGR